ncbi:hypothetical protein ACFQWB_03880 [Paenibacillus thermoaerophilus]|uniref:Uncharacterized protein n=1 Tax=Paenibacillus thermoaerophilus TaxID=1215385 RepID=A0ABW2UYV2_9BACL|nr:hypothetical protein [Paenibacillus thermoaerophilus]TMV16028.1 hypothetical protein FE781_09400 [Paenibacillus thermoaerophilus]
MGGTIQRLRRFYLPNSFRAIEKIFMKKQKTHPDKVCVPSVLRLCRAASGLQARPGEAFRFASHEVVAGADSDRRPALVSIPARPVHHVVSNLKVTAIVATDS